MNTGKQINAMVAVLFMVLIAIGAYTIWDPFRSHDAQGEQLSKSADFGAQTFERNCRVCHGDTGQGPPTSGRLDAALPLDTAELQGIKDGAFDQATFDISYKKVYNTIMCGRVGTAMPTWGAANGGTLNNEQVRQLAILITQGRWDLAQEHANATDATTTNNAKIDVPGGAFAADATDLVVSNAGAFTRGQYVRIGDGKDEERLRVLPKEILVDRGVDGTTAADHDVGTQLLVNGQPIIRNPSPTLRNGSLVPLGGSAESLAEKITKDDTALPVGDNSGFNVGDIIALGDEHVRVTGTTTGIPSTGAFLAKSIGREPKKLFVSGTGDMQDGDLIRIDSEPMTVQDIGEGGTGVKLDADVSATSDVVSVNDPRFLRAGYQFRLGDEWLEVVNPVDTGQTVADAIGRAQSTLSVSGTLGIEKGSIIRVDGELMRVTEIVRPARVQLTRGVDGTTMSSHDAGTTLLKPADKNAKDQTPTDTGQTTIEPLSADHTVLAVSGITKLNVGDNYKLGDETVTLLAADPAIVRIERGVQKTDVEEHSRRAPIFVGNDLAVTRGVNNTSAAAHASGDEVDMTQIKVKRAVGVKPAEHGKNTEIFVGNHLTVARGQKNTQAAEHKNGDLVRNFPTAPDGPAITGMGGLNVCGQNGPLEEPTPSGTQGPTPTSVPGATTVNVDLKEFSVTPDQTSVAAGPVTFNVSNIGASVHNFRVIKTDLAPDALPLSGNHVDETQVDVVAHSTGNINAKASQSISVTLEAGNYVLICNVPAHYKTGMHVAFTVQ